MAKKNNEDDFVKRIKVTLNGEVIIETDNSLDGEANGEEE